MQDKYGRKAVLLFGLIMTSLSTIYLGLATCYHDAMWALVFQGACTGIVPVSKCAIGEIANRQQKICDAQLAALPKHRHNCHHQHQQQQQEQEHELEQCSTRPSGYETRRHHPRHYAMNEMTGEIMEDKQARRFDSSPCSHPECQNDFEQIENSHQEKKHLQPREDYCAKGYSGLVIAVAAGAALGPLIGGSLARKQIPGFENHIYLAPCLVAACIVLCLTGLVALVLNETNPKWATPLALPPVYVEEARRVNVVHEHTVDHNLPASISSLTRTRGRPGYEQSQRFLREEGVHNNNNSVCISGSNDDSNVGSSLDTTCFEEVDKVDDHGGGVGSSGAGGRIAQRTTTRSKTTAAASDSLKCSSPLQLQHSHLQEQYPLPSPYRQRHNHVQPVQPLCSCLPVVSSLSPNSGITFKRTKSSPSTTSKKNTLSPATHLFLVLGIYSLLVLISILGSEFVMLYTQSPISRGGLEFSAKVLGQVLTMRGILKLTFNLLGYPWMVRRLGLVHCLRLGIAIIGVVSIFGMGSFVPWSIEQERSLMMMTMESSNSHEPTSIGVGPSDNDNSRGYRDHDPANNNQSPIGMSVVLLCMSMISMGDVLGYISVLVLFGKSADRLKGANKKDATEDGATTSNPNQQQTQSGSGILWSVAQVSANIMRLAGPVIAGLLWSLTDKGHPGAKSDETVGPFSAHRMSPESSAAIMHGTQTTFSLPGTTIDDSDDKDISSTKVSSLTSLFIYVFSGPTSVFYLVGAICVLNFIACQYLLPSESSSTSSFDSHGPPFENVQEQQYLEQQQERCDESLNTVGDYTFGDKEEKWEESKEGNNNVDPEKVLSSGTGVRHVATAGSTM
ncbi:hypothetical protein BG004_006839 [Podila humilis]|nr:hypothetical protein BG004_006839 [Podila humilis]